MIRTRRSKAKLKIYKTRCKIDITFNEEITKEQRNKIVTQLKKDDNLKLVIVLKNTKDIIKIRATYTSYCRCYADDLSIYLEELADDYLLNITVTNLKDKNDSRTYNGTERTYRVYYHESRTEEYVAYIKGKNKEDAEERFHNGDYWDCDYVDTVDSEILDIVDIERD